ncbi:MAG: glycoside hydrolase family 140 protein [Defluviitaleaceae bacterium]|nr:glycoside hydrolase family 140 protein [Defluviitaleaceae bacterium]
MKPWENGKLSVKGRYFFNGDVPFFWMGDTAWRLFQCLNIEESRKYLINRADKGYNVIQAVLLAGVGFTTEDPTRIPRLDSDMDAFLSKENEPFWSHVEAVISMARDMGIYMVLLPVWGDFAKIEFLTCENANRYMKFLSDRFNKYENIVWLLGGDIRGRDHYELWDMCGKALREYSPGKLIGYHPFGRTSSSYWFHNCDWLDYNQFQSGHRRYDQQFFNSSDNTGDDEPWYGEDSYKFVVADLAKQPLKPTLDGEPSYEHIPQGLHDGTQPYWQEHHVRRYAWWPVLAGASGHTYGDNSVMQMYGKGTRPAFSVKDTWDEGIHHAGAGQMQFLRNIMEEIGFAACEPMQEIVVDQREKEEAILAFGNKNNIVIYNYTGREFGLKLPTKMDAWWYDPSSGVSSYFGTVDLTGGHLFTPPIRPVGHNDWVLLLHNC